MFYLHLHVLIMFLQASAPYTIIYDHVYLVGALNAIEMLNFPINLNIVCISNIISYFQEENQTEYYSDGDDVFDDMDLLLDYDVDNDVDDDEDGYTTASGLRERKKQTMKKEENICLTQIVKLIDNEINSVQLIRAMLCQAVRFHSNSSARAAITEKKMLDVKGKIVVHIFEW